MSTSTVVRSKAFSLLELILALAMISVLTVLAIPAYDEYRLRAQRSEVVRELLDLAGCQAQQRASRGAYDTTACQPDQASKHYRFTVIPDGEKRVFQFRYTAEPLQPTASDRCGSFGIDHLGRRSITGEGEITLECWGGR